MVKAGIIGATGYAGVELLRLLINHPGAEIGGISSISFEGKNMDDVYPAFKDICGTQLLAEDEVIAASDVVFAAVPHGHSDAIAAKCKRQGAVLIDIGADFRLKDETDYEKWYGGNFADKQAHADAVYSIPELHRSSVAKADIIANPGCYPTTVSLGLYPAISNKLISLQGIIADCKSGVTGAGRGLSQKTHFPDAHESFSAYGVAAHRHQPEIEQTLSALAGEQATVTFVPHLLPINRGILSTIYADLLSGKTLPDIHASYERAYANEQFVRLLPLGSTATIRGVQCSNYCDISLHMDEHAGKLIVISVIDNMLKGAAGQAIQNMNIRFGLDESAGLNLIPISF